VVPPIEPPGKAAAGTLRHLERSTAAAHHWEKRKDPHAFARALEQEGYHLARGDSGRYVVIDHAGEIHSLYRQIPGVKAPEIKAFLGEAYPLKELRHVETARAAGGAGAAAPGTAAVWACARRKTSARHDRVPVAHHTQWSSWIQEVTSLRAGPFIAAPLPSNFRTAPHPGTKGAC